MQSPSVIGVSTSSNIRDSFPLVSMNSQRLQDLACLDLSLPVVLVCAISQLR